MPPQQPSSSQDPGTSDFAWFAIIIVVGLVIAWYFFQKQIINFIYEIRYYEIIAMQYAVDAWNTAVVKVNMPFLQWHANKLQTLASAIHNRNVGSSFNALQSISTNVGDYLRILFAPLLVLLGLIIYKTNVHLKLKTVFNMKNMKQSEKDDWPQIMPVLKLNLVKEDIDKGPWAMAMIPMDFCKKHKILKEKKDERGKPAVELIPDQAYQLFVTQLGPLWTQVMSLPRHARALFAAFAACGNHDRDAAFELLQKINCSATDKKLDFDGTDQLLAKYFNTKLVIKVLQRHAYVTTVFMSMLEFARTDGVLATSDFLWLKPLDRRLWYVLNTVGRYTPVPEAAGPYAHWLAEKKWGGPLRVPMMEEAVRGMEDALTEILYEPEED
jgi:intracellular multiplication protein IcmP